VKKAEKGSGKQEAGSRKQEAGSRYQLPRNEALTPEAVTCFLLPASLLSSLL
jgi:hypothetical protein